MNNPVSEAVRVPLERVQRIALVVGVIALAACGVGAALTPTDFFRSYLMAYEFVLGLGLGSLVLLMVQHLIGGAWGYLVRRILEAGALTLPLLALLFVPIALGLPQLYLWARPEVVADNPNLKIKEIYLNVPFFMARAAFYFAGWTLLALLLRYYSRRQDRDGAEPSRQRLIQLSGPGLVFYGITLTFAAVDWVMSLQPTFRSTIFGPLVAGSEVLSAHALAILVCLWLATRPPLDAAFSKSVCGDLGNLLLTLVIIWAYLVFFQFMLIWIANLRAEVLWLLDRGRDGWQFVAYATGALGLGIPFLALLLRDLKRTPRALAVVAGMVLFSQLLFAALQVLPAFQGTHLAQHWMDFLTPLGLGGLWLAWFLFVLMRAPLLPRCDPNQATAAELRDLDREEAADEAESRQEEVIHV